MAQLFCSACREAATADVEYYTLDSDPTASNDLTLKEKLLYCVPEFEEILNDDGGNAWICSVCCQALCSGYFFRKMCLEVKSKWDMVINDPGFCVVKEEAIDIDDTNFVSVKNEVNEIKTEVFSDEIKTEVFSDEECKYTLVEIEETADPLEIKQEDFLLIENLCKTNPELREKNLTPESLQCYVEVESLNQNQIKQMMTKKRHKRRRKKGIYSNVKRPAVNKQFLVCNICHRRFNSVYNLNYHLRTHNKNVVEQNCELKKKPKLSMKPKTNKRQSGSFCIDFVTTKFENLTIRKRFLQPRSTQETMPKLLSELLPFTKTKKIRAGLLQEPVLTLKQNDSTKTDLCEQQPHEKFGISITPSYPASDTTTVHPETCLVTEDALEKNMTDYILSILKESNPNAVMLPPPAIDNQRSKYFFRNRRENQPRNCQQKKQKRAISPEITDHTYSLRSKKFNETCLECGSTFDMVELYDYHVDNYHGAWWLIKEESMKVKSMVLEDLYHKNLASESDTALSDLEEELGRSERFCGRQHKKPRARKRSEIDKSNNEKSDSETDSAEEATLQSGAEKQAAVKKVEQFFSIQKHRKSIEQYENQFAADPIARQHLSSPDEQQKTVIVYNSRTQCSPLVEKPIANQEDLGVPTSTISLQRSASHNVHIKQATNQNARNNIVSVLDLPDQTPVNYTHQGTNESKVIVHHIQIFKNGIPVLDQNSPVISHLQASGSKQKDPRPKSSKKRYPKSVTTDENVQSNCKLAHTPVNLQKTPTVPQSETIQRNLNVPSANRNDQQKKERRPKQRVKPPLGSHSTPESVIRYQPRISTILPSNSNQGNLNVKEPLDQAKLALSPAKYQETIHGNLNVALANDNIQQRPTQHRKSQNSVPTVLPPETIQGNLKAAHTNEIIQPKQKQYPTDHPESAAIVHREVSTLAQSNTIQKNISVELCDEQVQRPKQCTEELLDYQKLVLTPEGVRIVSIVQQSNTVQKNVSEVLCDEQVQRPKQCTKEPLDHQRLVLTPESAGIVDKEVSTIQQSNTDQKNVSVVLSDEQVQRPKHCTKEPLDNQRLVLTSESAGIVNKVISTVEQVQRPKEPLNLPSENVAKVQQEQELCQEGKNNTSLLRDILGRPQQTPSCPPLCFLSAPSVSQQNTQQPLYWLLNSSAANEVPLIITTDNTGTPQFIRIIPETTVGITKQTKPKKKNLYILPAPVNTVTSPSLILAPTPSNQNQIIVNDVQPSTSKVEQTADTSDSSVKLPNILLKKRKRSEKSLIKSSRPVMQPIDSVGDQTKKKEDVLVKKAPKLRRGYAELIHELLEKTNEEQYNATAKPAGIKGAKTLENSETACHSSSYESKGMDETFLETQCGSSLKRRMDDDNDSRKSFKKPKTGEVLGSTTDMSSTFSPQIEEKESDSADNFELNGLLSKMEADKPLCERQEEEQEESQEMVKKVEENKTEAAQEVQLSSITEGQAKETWEKDGSKNEDTLLELQQLDGDIEDLKPEMANGTIFDSSLLGNEKGTIEQLCDSGSEETMKVAKPKKNRPKKSYLTHRKGPRRTKRGIREEKVIDKKVKSEVERTEIQCATTVAKDNDEIAKESDVTPVSDIKEKVTIPELTDLTHQVVYKHSSLYSTDDKNNTLHIDNCHTEKKSDVDIFPPCKFTFNEGCTSTLQDSKIEKTPHHCGVCNRTFNEMYALNLHRIEHNYEKPVDDVMKEVQERTDETME